GRHAMAPGTRGAQAGPAWRGDQDRTVRRRTARSHSAGNCCRRQAAVGRAAGHRLFVDRRGLLYHQDPGRSGRGSDQDRKLAAHGYTARDQAVQGWRGRRESQRVLCRPKFQQAQRHDQRKDERGLRLVKRLIADAHLVSNNFTPGVMDKLGLGYGVLRELRPGLVFASMSMQGASGPAAKDLGYGLTIAALTGFMHLTGLPDREPAGTGTNYPDHIPNPGHAAFAILAALRHQRRSGQGQLIDLAQMEPTLAMLGPTLMNYFVNGVIEQRAGNTHPER